MSILHYNKSQVITATLALIFLLAILFSSTNQINISLDPNGEQKNPSILSEFSGSPPNSGEIVSKFASILSFFLTMYLDQQDFSQPWLQKYYKVASFTSNKIGRIHRKIWEMAYIMHVIESLGKCNNEGQSGFVWAAYVFHSLTHS
jgi:hypothetical protein